MRLIANTTVADVATERFRQEVSSALREVQASPFMDARIVRDVQLANGVETPVAHGLGRLPLWVRESCPRGAVSTGRIEEITGTHDRKKYVVLKATGFGATISVDVVII